MIVAPSAALPPFTSATLPLWTAVSLKKPSPEGVTVHFWQSFPFHGQIWILVPLSGLA